MAISFKQKCSRCKKNFVIATRRSRWVECWDCEKAIVLKKVDDPKLGPMFDIPTEYYEQNSFLRSIKKNYHRFENLTDKQVEAFKKTVQEMKDGTNRVQVEAKKKEEIDPSKIELHDRVY
ncbi:hypothetical protein HOC01_05685 [archaeon]|jgi:DNA-directed RNA polymerase subunit RPC12/RpoP|nr:hypothetical protein [archaeon]MBT6697668.1 hypothetical protein [archaeon]